MEKFKTYLQTAKENMKNLLVNFNGSEEIEEIEEKADKKETLKKSKNKTKPSENRTRSEEQRRERKLRAEREQAGDERPRRKSSSDVRTQKRRPANVRPEQARPSKTSRTVNEQQRKKKPAAHAAKKRANEQTKTKLTWRTCLESIKHAVKRDFRPATFKKHTHLFIFPIIFVYFEIILRVCAGTSVFSHLIYPVLFGLATGFFVTFITLLFPRPINRKISIVIFFLTGLLFTTECLVKRSFQWYLPLSGILGGAGDVAGGYIGETIKAIVSGIPVIILFFLPGVLYLKLGQKFVPARRFKIVKALRFLGYSAFIMAVAVLVANVGSSAAKYKSQYKFDTATEYFGLLTSLRLETKYSIFGNSSSSKFVVEDDAEKESETEVKEIVYGKNEMELDFSKVDPNNEELQELNTYVQSLKPSSQNAYTGLFEGKNLILITAEALSDVVISKELTPTLYRLTHNGFYFSDFYQPTWGGSTSTGEFSFLLGLVPLKLSQSMKEVRNNNLYFTLGNQLQREGYYSAAFHNGTHDYYDRHMTHENLGYSSFTACGNGLDVFLDYYPDDETFLEGTIELCMTQQPFSLYYMTVSGHCIYDENKFTEEYMEHVESVLGTDTYDDTTMNYFCYQMELEKAMTTLIAKLEEAGIADDTVICMTSDHYPYGLENTTTFGNTKDYVADLYGYDPEYSWEQDHNSLVIWSGCLENEHKDKVCEISTPTYSLDVVPTLSNLFGLEYDSRLLVGRDVFSDAEPIAIWNNYSWVTEKGKYDSASDTFFPNEGVTVSDSYVERIHSIVSNRISFSGKAMNNDYYAALFGKDTETGKTITKLMDAMDPEKATETEETAETTETVEIETE